MSSIVFGVFFVVDVVVVVVVVVVGVREVRRGRGRGVRRGGGGGRATGERFGEEREAGIAPMWVPCSWMEAVGVKVFG